MKENEFFNELREIKGLLQLQQPILTLRQFCKFADISEDYAYKLTSSGKVKYYRPLGKKIYIEREDAIEFLKQNPVGVRKKLDTLTNNYFLKSKI